MWRNLAITLAAVVLASCGGGINSYEDAMNAQSDIMRDMVQVLEGVNDEESAEKAAAKIEAFGTELMEIANQVKDLPRPSMEEMQKISKKQMEHSGEFQTKAAGQMMKLMQYPVLGKAWTNAMSNAG